MDVYQKIPSGQHHGHALRRCSRLSSGSWWSQRVVLAAFADCGEGEQGGDGDLPIAHGRPTFHHPRIRAPIHLNTKLFFAAVPSATTTTLTGRNLPSCIRHPLA
ncbi:hypothetical protein IG631_16146 [Alternaria alternata]|nr:hypothetical protein IG631_16146 [Alternaria alternata]